jgi:hypothetical protein
VVFPISGEFHVGKNKQKHGPLSVLSPRNEGHQGFPFLIGNGGSIHHSSQGLQQDITIHLLLQQ